MDQETDVADHDQHDTATASAEATDIVADESLIEEISIDGMCGVY